MRTGSRRAFTLIELLTVIAIIAVLAALLMPVFSRVRENARKTTCLSNLHQIYVALDLYRQDNNEYPALLLGYAERPDGLPWAPGDPGPVPAGRIQNGFLLAKYLKNDVTIFHCPDNPRNDQTLTTTAVLAPGSPPNSFTGTSPTIASLGLDVPSQYQSRPLYLYLYDSYDLTSFMNPDGTANGSYEIVYWRNWHEWNDPSDPKPTQTDDYPNQLKYRNAPPDKTVITWCDYHVTSAGGDQCPLLLASGTAKPRPYKQVVQYGWNVAGQ